MIRKTRSRRGGNQLAGLFRKTKAAVATGFGQTKAAVSAAAGKTKKAVTTGFNKTQKAAVCTKLRKLVEAGKAAQDELNERKGDPAKECRPPDVVNAQKKANAAVKARAKAASTAAYQAVLDEHTAAQQKTSPGWSLDGGGRKSRRKGRKSRRRGTRKGMRRKTARRASASAQLAALRASHLMCIQCLRHARRANKRKH